MFSDKLLLNGYLFIYECISFLLGLKEQWGYTMKMSAAHLREGFLNILNIGVCGCSSVIHDFKVLLL